MAVKVPDLILKHECESRNFETVHIKYYVNVPIIQYLMYLFKQEKAFWSR